MYIDLCLLILQKKKGISQNKKNDNRIVYVRRYFLRLQIIVV